MVRAKTHRALDKKTQDMLESLRKALLEEEEIQRMLDQDLLAPRKPQ